ncbi:MAG: TIGR02757 family protein [Bacteroidales bacterium]|nr:TIGR02757 family protein [Bacteroidales bacterium]
MSPKTIDLLRQYADRYETGNFIQGDPSWWMHQVEGNANREATAFVAAALSYGSRSQFMPKIGTLLHYAEGDMQRWIAQGLYRRHFESGDKTCFYRLYNNAAMRQFLDNCNSLLNQHGTFGGFVAAMPTPQNNTKRDALNVVDAFCRFFAQNPTPVIPTSTNSACKRLCMFMRWMVRDHSPVDLGLWAHLVDKQTLIIPLDTHVVSEAQRLHLIECSNATMSTALKLTRKMQLVFPDDPARADFALFGYGVDNN